MKCAKRRACNDPLPIPPPASRGTKGLDDAIEAPQGPDHSMECALWVIAGLLAYGLGVLNRTGGAIMMLSYRQQRPEVRERTE